VRPEADRASRFERIFQIALTHLAHDLNETYTTAGELGAAVWKRPGQWKTRLLEDLRLIGPYAQVTGWRHLLRFVKVVDIIKKKHEQHAPEPHYYLFILGVDPEAQGRTIGSQLLAPVVAKCDAEGRPAYLETALERDIKFYEKHGFTVCEHLVHLPHDAPPMWLMRREAPQGPEPAPIVR
jgi:ribosomal protein S18 acetylase RimI-like enzyme